MIGSCVSHYRILEKLGAGGMGEVYAAEDVHLGRRVAVKFPSLKDEGRDHRSRFLSEARAASRLDHPNIARIYDYGDPPDGRPFLVMELIAGTTLRQVLKEGPLPWARSVGIVEGVARALREAHRNGFLHRDIKPSNVMLTEAGEVKVLDFGLAKEILEAPTGTGLEAETVTMGPTRPGALPGTPAYMSPEQARAGLLDGRSDLFSAGLVLYECLTGRPAFTGVSRHDVLAMVVGANPPPPSACAPGVPATLDRVTAKALAKDPAQRYQTADDLLADLTSVTAAQTGSAYRNATAALAGVMESPRRLVVFSLAAVVVAMGAMWLLWPSRPPPPPEALRWYQSGAAALRDATYYGAIRALERAVATYPDFALAHARLAEAWNELDDSEKAKEEMLQALAAQSVHPQNRPAALYIEAIHRTLMGDFPFAIRSYAELAGQAGDPEKAQVLVDLGRSHERNGEVPKALEAYRQAAAHDPQNAAAHLRAGILLAARLRKMDEAAAQFAQAESLYSP